MMTTRAQSGFTIDGITINTPTMDDAVTSIVNAAQQGQSFSVCTLNLDHVVQLKARRDFRHASGLPLGAL